MRIYAPVVLWTGNCLLGVLLYRGARARLFSRYPIFYGYVAFVLCSSLVRFRLSFVSREAYALGYWASEFLAALLGVGVLSEIYTTVFAPYPGVRRMGRALIAVLVVAAGAKFAMDVAAHPATDLMPTTVELERNLRFMQALILLVMLVLLRYYRVLLGGNLAYLLMGYTLFIGGSVVNLTLRSAVGPGFQRWWTLLQPLEYLAVVVLWSVGLWSRSADPVPRLAYVQDYAGAGRQTSVGLARLRSRLVDAFRS